jgi:hypothetical protein
LQTSGDSVDKKDNMNEMPAPRIVYVQQDPPGVSGAGVTGFVLSIVALVCSLVPCTSLFALPPMMTALVCSCSALIHAKVENKVKWMPVTGIVLCAVTIVWLPIFIFVIMGSLGAALAGLPVLGEMAKHQGL